MTDKNKKPDFVLADGREIFFDFGDVTVGEWRKVRDPLDPPENEDKFIARIAGNLTAEEIAALDMITWRKMTTAMFEVALAPPADIVLSDGRQVGEDVKFDFSKLSVKEWRAMNTDEDEYRVIPSIATGLPEDIDAMLLTDWRKVKSGFYREAVNPLVGQS